MTLSSTANRVAYAGDGTTTLFAVPFVFFANAHIAVTLRDAAGGDAPWAEHTHYTLAGAGQPGGGTLTVKTAPANHTPPAGSTLTIRRVVPLTQETDYVENDPFPAAAHERALDLAAMRDQQLQEQIDRTLRFPVTDTAPIPGLPSFATRANKYLGFDGDGDPTLFSTLLDIQQSVAEGGTAPRLLTEHFGDALDVRDFGCKGDGATDDTANFQAALNYADANGRRLGVPDGTYLVGPLTIDGPMALELSPKATIKLKAAANVNLLTISGDNVTIRGGTLDGNRANQTSNGTGIYVSSGSENVVIEGCTIRACYGHGVYATDNCPGLTLRRNHINDVRLCGAFLQLAVNQSVAGVRVQDNVIDRSAESAATAIQDGLKIWGGTAANVLLQPIITGNRVHLPANPTNTMLGIEIWFARHGTIAANAVRGGTYGISFAQAHDNTIVGSTCIDQTFICFELAGCQRNSVVGVVCDGAQRGENTGVSLSAASGVSPLDNSIAGVAVKDVGRAVYASNANGLALTGVRGKAYSSSGAAGYYFINLAATQGFSITGCHIDGNNVGNKGIFLDTSWNGVVTGNDIRNWTQHGILIYAVSAVTIDNLCIAGNMCNVIGQSLSGGAALASMGVRLGGNKLNSGNAGIVDWDDFRNYLGTMIASVAGHNVQDGGANLFAAQGTIFRRLSGPGRHLYLKQVGSSASLNAYGYRTLEPWHPARMYLFDDFLGALDSRWGNRVGSHVSVVAPAYNAQAGGACRLVTGADVAGTMASNGVQLHNALVWQADSSDVLSAEFRIKLSATTDVAVFIGFTDQVAALEMPVESAASADSITTNATDAAGVMFDTAMATDNWWLVGVKADVDATAQNASVAPVTGTYETWRVELNNSGNAAFFRNGVLVGSFMSNAVTAATALTPVVAALSRGAASRNIDLDVIEVMQIRPGV